MPTIYSAAADQWPLLQSKTEQKFKSGLFNVSAEFIRPVGDTSLPTQIETSIGSVNVWPEPTVSSGTDGFERINATGYGVWDDGISEVVIGLQLGEVKAAFSFFPFCFIPGGCGYGLQQIDCGLQYPVDTAPSVRMARKEVLFETVFVKKIGSQVPAIPSPLKIYNLAGNDITSQDINFSEFQPFFYIGDQGSGTAADGNYNRYISEANTTGTFQAPIQTITRLTQVSRVNYGEITETSATYEVLSCFVNYGTLVENPVAVDCP